MSQEIFEDVLSILHQELPLNDISVERVCCGWGFTGVQLSTGDVGLCHSLLGEVSPACGQIVEQSGALTGSPVTALTELAESWNIGESVIGVAVINALSQPILKERYEPPSHARQSVLDEMRLRPTDTVAMMGNIKPLVPAIRSMASKLLIFERGRSIDDTVLPDPASEELLPRADVVVIIGSAIANGTIGRLLELSKNARTVGIVGPSASIIPDPLFRRGVDVIGGVIVTDAERAMQIVAEGGGTPQLKKATRKFVEMKGGVKPVQSCQVQVMLKA